MAELRREQYRDFIGKFNLKGKKIIEVGAGQGEFLMHLKPFDVHAFGLENNRELLERARAKGLNMIPGYIDEMGDSVLKDGPFDAFLSFNFLEHQPNPRRHLRAIRINLVSNAVGLITVPSFDYILDNGSYFELMRDHIANYSEKTFRICLETNGFEVLETGLALPDTMYAYVQKKERLDVSGLDETYNALDRQLSDFLG
jgi:SAM-dependent methyltransferase